MSKHRELKNQKKAYLSQIDDLNLSIDRVVDANKVCHNMLKGIDSEQEKTIEETKKTTLANEINKHTFKHSEILSKLQKKKEEILSNKEKKLANITYEKFSKKTKDKLSVEDSIKRSEEIKSMLDEKIGKRLSSELSRVIPGNKGFNSLSEIQEAFIELESTAGKLGKSRDLLPRLESMVFSYDAGELDKNGTIMFLVVVLILLIMLIYSMPLLIIALSVLFICNVHKSLVYYHAMSIAKVLVSNVNKINSSIEEGIKNKVKSKQVEIEGKFQVMLDNVDKKISTVEELILDVTEEIERDFVFNDSSIIESYKSKKDSITEQVSRNDNQIKDYFSQIDTINEKIKEIDKEILAEGKNIFEKYYPPSGYVEEGSYIYLDDILLDIIDNDPLLLELPRGSAIYLYKDEQQMFNYLTLYLTSLYSRMVISSLYVKLFDFKYAGTKTINFASIESFSQVLNKEDVKSQIELLNKEMMKRIKILGSKQIDDYNKEMIEDDSAPLDYHIIIDLFNKPSDNGEQNQLLINGFKYGIVYNSFLNVKDIEGDEKMIDKIKSTYGNYYFIGDAGVNKKSSKFLDALKAKK